MSAQIDTATDSLIASNQNKAKAKSSDDSGTANVFASLIQGQLPSNITFSRIDAELTLPQKSASPDFKDPLNLDSKYLNRSADDEYESAAANDSADDEVENEEPTASNDHKEKLNIPDYNSELVLAAPTATAASNTEGADAQITPSDPVAASALVQAGTPQVKPDVTPTLPPAATNAPAQTASSAKDQIIAQSQDVPEVPGTETTPTAKQSGENQNNIQATVSDKPDAVIAQPANSLAASAVVAAQSGKESQNAGEIKPSATAENLNTSEEGTVNNAFTKGQNQNNNSNGQQNGQQNAGQKNGAEIAQNNANENAPQNANFNSALNATPSAPPPALNATPQASSSISQPISIEPTSSSVTGVATQNITTQARATVASTPQTRPNVPPHIVSEQVAVNIQRAIGAGVDRINIQLRPQELGRIDVAMEMGKDGRMTAVITAERPDTLDMLKSDAKGLIQSLNDAGLQTDSSSLSFNLKSDGEGAPQFASSDANKNDQDAKEFSLDNDDELLAESAQMLADGETAQLDDDGHLDVKV